MPDDTPDIIDAELRPHVLTVLLMKQGRWWTPAEVTPALRDLHAGATYDRAKTALDWAADQGFAERRKDEIRTLIPGKPQHVYKITLKGIDKATED